MAIFMGPRVRSRYVPSCRWFNNVQMANEVGLKVITEFRLHPINTTFSPL